MTAHEKIEALAFADECHKEAVGYDWRLALMSRYIKEAAKIGDREAVEKWTLPAHEILQMKRDSYVF